jgi:spore maturation protein CgeB
MKICYLTSYYPPFLDTLYKKHNYFNGLSYNATLDLVLDELYADTGAICYYSKAYGNEANIIIQNCDILQKKWAVENNVVFTETDWPARIVLEQIKKWRPDVFYTESIQDHSTHFFDVIKENVKRIVAWISFPFDTLPNLDKLDLVVTSTKNYQKRFKELGLRAEYMLPAFDERILSRLNNNQKQIPFSFIGGISAVHKKRWEALNYLCNATDIKLWGYGLPAAQKNTLKKLFKRDIYSAIRKKHNGGLWGLQMYQTLQDSLITFNIHEDLLKGDVGNMRMFEASGVGTALLNDEGNNLTQLFEPGSEIIVYKDLPDAVEKVNYYLQHPHKAIEIGKNAQKRTLREYNYTNYTIQMMDFIKKTL